MNIGADLPHIGGLIWQDKMLIRKDIHRIETAWRNILKLSMPILGRKIQRFRWVLRPDCDAYTVLWPAY